MSRKKKNWNSVLLKSMNEQKSVQQPDKGKGKKNGQRNRFKRNNGRK